MESFFARTIAGINSGDDTCFDGFETPRAASGERYCASSATLLVAESRFAFTLIDVMMFVRSRVIESGLVVVTTITGIGKMMCRDGVGTEAAFNAMEGGTVFLARRHSRRSYRYRRVYVPIPGSLLL